MKTTDEGGKKTAKSKLTITQNDVTLYAQLYEHVGNVFN